MKNVTSHKAAERFAHIDHISQMVVTTDHQTAIAIECIYH